MFIANMTMDKNNQFQLIYPIKLGLKRIVCLHFLPVNVNIQKMIQVLFEIAAKYNSKMLSIDTYYKDLSHATVTWSSTNTFTNGSLTFEK